MAPGQVMQKYGEKISQTEVCKLQSHPDYIYFRAPFGLGLKIFYLHNAKILLKNKWKLIHTEVSEKHFSYKPVGEVSWDSQHIN